MPKLTKRANRYGRTDPYCRKASLLKIKHIKAKQFLRRIYKREVKGGKIQRSKGIKQ